MPSACRNGSHSAVRGGLSPYAWHRALRRQRNDVLLDDRRTCRCCCGHWRRRLASEQLWDYSCDAAIAVYLDCCVYYCWAWNYRCCCYYYCWFWVWCCCWCWWLWRDQVLATRCSPRWWHSSCWHCCAWVPIHRDLNVGTTLRSSDSYGDYMEITNKKYKK